MVGESEIDRTFEDVGSNLILEEWNHGMRAESPLRKKDNVRQIA